MGSESVWKPGLHSNTQAQESSVTSEVLENNPLRKVVRWGLDQKCFPSEKSGNKKE